MLKYIFILFHLINQAALEPKNLLHAFYNVHTFETVKYYKQKNKILSICVYLSSTPLIAEMFRIINSVTQKLQSVTHL